MLLCLSSGHSRRYREDVLRSAGLPSGAIIQFRYDDKHLGPGVKTMINTGTIAGNHVLIAYSDQAERDRDPELVPCRYATILSLERAGTTVSLKLRLQDHAYAENISAFNIELRQLSAGLTPHRVGAEKISGCYFTELNVEPRAISRTLDSENWQKLVDQLASRSDFQNYETFLLLQSIRMVSGKQAPVESGWHIQLKPASRYVLKMYQYHPTKIPVATQIEVMSTTTRIRFASYSTFMLDSRYDHKELVFESTAGLDAEQSLIRIVQKNVRNEELTVSYDIPLAISNGWGRAVGYALLVALLLAAPHVTSALTNPSLTDWKLGTVLWVATISSVCAALLAVFKIRRIL
jgi:hypothetical protein